MRRTAILEGVRMMRFLDVFGRCGRRELSRLEAAELLGVNERTLRRWCRRFEAEGEAGLVTSAFVTTRKQLESEIHCVSKTDVCETGMNLDSRANPNTEGVKPHQAALKSCDDRSLKISRGV